MSNGQRTRSARAKVIMISGGSRASQVDAERAEQVGRLLAKAGAVVLTGGGSGVMEAASRGCREAGGTALAVLPGSDESESPPNEHVSLANVIDHVDHICQLAGDSRHVAIGSDLDGGFGREQSPHDLDTIADLQKLAAMLAERGYSDADVAAVMHGNWLRLLRQSWGDCHGAVSS